MSSLTLMMFLLLAFGVGTLLFWWSDFGRLSKARALIAAGAPLVDIDSASAFAHGHMAGAINIPFDDLGRRAHELDPRKPVVVCGRGKLRATRAAHALRERGFYEVLSIGRKTL